MVVTDWICCILYHYAIHRLYGHETDIPWFRHMPISWQSAIWRFTAAVYARAFRYDLRRV
jgi:hypothetical protein